MGEGVTGLELGELVMAISPNSLATHTTTAASLVVPLPRNVSVIEAATIPIVQLTSYYALHYAGRLRANERVLIHSAAGGVGTAALQWARHAGAEIYATAGTDEKREWLRAQGIEYVSDSRSARFVEDIQRWTKGEGVDVVLNALSGPLLEKSFALLRTGGRFVEIGKRDYFANKSLGLNPFLRGLTFTLVDLDTMVRENPQHVHQLFLELLGHIEAGHLTPLPLSTRPLSQASEVFWEMGRGRHIGKFVLTHAETQPLNIAAPIDRNEVTLSRDASYLITGGLGGLGLVLARWMAEQGAGHIVLCGRRGVTSSEQREAVAALEALGTKVTVATTDVTQFFALKQLVAELPSSQPLRGIVHAAGLLDDALLINQTSEKFLNVLRPKVVGAWNLHVLSRDLKLDFFVLYSSSAATFGSPGQGNYVAANAFLDGLAHHRQRLALPALSLNWGTFSGVGLAAAEEIRGERLAGRGITELSPAEGVELFSRLVANPVTQVAPCPFDAQQWAEFYPQTTSWPYLSELLAERESSRADVSSELLVALSASGSAEAHKLLLKVVLDELARVIRMDAATLDPEARMADLGVDSLMGIEFRNRLKATTGADLPSTLIWTYPTPAALADHLASLLIPAGVAEADGRMPELNEPKPSSERPSSLQSRPAATDSVSELIHEVRSWGETSTRSDGKNLIRLLAGGWDLDPQLCIAVIRTLTEIRQGTSARQGLALNVTKPIQLSQSASKTSLYCIPSLAIPSSPVQYLRLSTLVREHASTWSAPNLGYSAGHAVPGSLEELISGHVQVLSDQLIPAPNVLVGFSGGGWLVFDVLRELERRRVSPAPVAAVMIDTPFPNANPDEAQWIFIRRSLDYYNSTPTPNVDEMLDDMTGMASNIALYQSAWQPSVIETPVLFLKALRGFSISGDLTESTIVTNPEETWANFVPNLTIREIDTNHFQAIHDYTTLAEITAMIFEWLSSLS
jgi:NADPH:quinone reductase-like Zn-dependent oxidoreductase/thioesterase domain-containing protein/acyl carrier protein